MTISIGKAINIDETSLLLTYLKKYKNITIAKYMPIFDVSGTATGNDIIALMNQSTSFYIAASEIVINQTAQEIQDNWMFVYNENIPDIRNQLISLGALASSLNTTLSNNAALIAGTFDSSGSFIYSALTSGQRAAVKALLDPIDAFII